MKRFCARCGKPEDSTTRLLNNFCPQCHLDLHAPIKNGATFETAVCGRCHSYKRENNWVKPIADPILEAATIRLLNIISPPYTFTINRAKGSIPSQTRTPLVVEIREESSALSQLQTKVQVVAEVKVGLCDTCQSASASTERYIIQIRGHQAQLDSRIHQYLRAHIRSVPRRRARIELVKGGIDVYLQDPNQAQTLINSIAGDYPCKVVSTYSEKNGRHVTLARILNSDVGEIVEYGGKRVRILSIDKRSATVREIESGKKKILPLEALLP